MPVPKTNLFKGDRVKLSPSYIAGTKIMHEEVKARGYGGHAIETKSVECVGTIISDTLDPKLDEIKVHWDGNDKHHKSHVYMPCDLVLYEEEMAVA